MRLVIYLTDTAGVLEKCPIVKLLARRTWLFPWSEADFPSRSVWLYRGRSYHAVTSLQPRRVESRPLQDVPRMLYFENKPFPERLRYWRSFQGKTTLPSECRFLAAYRHFRRSGSQLLSLA